MTDFRQCPFCGSKNLEMEHVYVYNSIIYCKDCTAAVIFDAAKLVADSGEKDDWKTAIRKAWNRRCTDD